MEKFVKQPGEKLDYDLNCTEWLGADTITGASSVTAPAGLTVVSTTVNSDAQSVKVWLNGGTDGVTYKVTTTMTSNSGRIKEYDFYIKVKEV